MLLSMLLCGAVTAQTAGTGDGLTGTYFDNKDFTSPVFTRVDETINFFPEYGTGWGTNYGDGAPRADMGVDDFSVRWTGQIRPQYSETYTFYINSDDGVRLWINGQLVIDNWAGLGTVQGSIALSAGQKYDFKMEYFEGPGSAAVLLRWSSPSRVMEIVPKSCLFSATSSGPTPSAPTPQNLVATPGNGSVSLSWQNVTGATGYLIKRALVSGGPYQVLERVPQAQPTVSYTDTNVRNGTPYFYVVDALALASNGTQGEVSSVDSAQATATPQWPPSAPYNLAAIAGDKTAYLTWKGGARTDRFEVWRSITGGAWAKVAEPTTASYTDQNLTNGWVYAYYVLARNTVAASGNSNTVTTVPDVLATFAPGLPTFGTRTSNSIVVVTPPLPQRATSLTLQKRLSGYYSYSGASDYVTVATGLAGGASVTATGLSPRASYAFRYVAVGSGGQAEGYEATVNTLPLAPGAPDAPGFTSLTDTTLSVLTPPLPADALSFSVQSKPAGAPVTDYATLSTSASAGSTVPVTGLSAGASYDFRLLAVGEGGTTAGLLATVRTAPAAPAAPQFSQVTATSMAVTPGSTALPAGALSLSLERLGAGASSSSSYNSSTWITVASGLSPTSVTTVSNLVPNTGHTLRFVAVNASGRTPGPQGYQTTLSGTAGAPGAPGAPQYADVAPTSVSVIAPSPLDYYNSWTLQRKEAGQPDSAFADCGTLSYYSPSLSISGLSPATAYAFRFVAGGVAGTASVVTTAPLAPGVPTLASRTTGSLTLAMPALPAGATSLRLERLYGDAYYSYYGSYVVLARGLAGGQSVPVSGLSPHASYTFRCVAVGPNGETSGSTAPFSTLSPAPGTPEAPGFTAVAASQVTAAALPLPADAQTLTLQRKPASAPQSSYADVQAGLNGQGTTDVTGLQPATAYSFRWVAVGEGGSTPGPGVDVTTLPLPPQAPGVPDLSFASATAARVILPALPPGAISLSLQKYIYYYEQDWSTYAAGLPGGASLTVSGLSPGYTVQFRCVAVGPGGQTVGPTASITMPNGPPAAPAAPRFSDVREGSLTVWSPVMPAGANTMTLQGKGHNDPDSAYYDIATGLGANAATNVDGLEPGSAYDFRYVAVTYGASTPGAVASALMPTASVAWSAGQPVSCGGISYPGTGATLKVGQRGRLSSFLATDWDRRVTTVNGMATLQDISDPCSYSWSASAGTFEGGENTGQSPVWIAPTTPGTYTLTLVVDDQNGANKTAAEAGGRNDAARGFNEEPMRFSVKVTVGP